MGFEEPKFTQEPVQTPTRPKAVESVQFEGLSRNEPRDTLDAMVAFVQRGNRRTENLEYRGLLDEKEKKEFENQREAVKKAWTAKSTPETRIEGLMENRWQKYAQKSQTGVSGSVFLSRAFGNPEAHRAYEQDENEGRLSFSLNLSKADMFFDQIMSHLSEGRLADVPVKFKISEAYPERQGSGENAHLYFKARDAEKVYEAIEAIYPALEKNELLSLGGRFLMIPIKDKNGKTLKGVEFGQSLLTRSAVSTEKREEVLKVSRMGGVATSGVQAMFMNYMLDELPPDTFERLKILFKEKGADGVTHDKQFSDAYSRVRHHLIELGRDPSYPMLDRDARQAFPHFTKVIQK